MSDRFAAELAALLPEDLPQRSRVVDLLASHLERVSRVNEYMNLTRIVSPRDAAIKHALDSLMPWRWIEPHELVLDIGSGAGFPGIPLALALPGTRFVLAESVQKKAQFLRDAVEALALPNVEVLAERAEAVLRARTFRVTTARAVAPLERLIHLLAPVAQRTGRMLFYKGRDAGQEIAEAAAELKRRRLRARIAMTYELPDEAGQRHLVEVSPA
ncbi:MAG TPA: 16S rRNA (guanine(527)-N(7))-methyltransferase RsmG [Solibacterales bacterium]|nr:16S rRNA (guanine(527)-N(7))-methyltransferase RsmG [Bryobacterales bacterium]